MDKLTEKKAANILLERGVKVTVLAPFFLKWFGKKQLNIVIKAPTLATLIAIASESLSVEIDFDKTMNVQNAFSMVTKHGKSLSQIVALAIVNNPKRKLFIYIVANYICKKMAVKELYYLYQLVVLYGGVEDFISIIKFTQETRVTKPMNLSQKEKRS